MKEKLGRPVAARRQNFTGKRYGKLVALNFIRSGKNRESWWEMQCDCGNTCIKQIDACKAGVVKSCGCAKKDKRPSRCKDHTGKRFGNLVALKLSRTDKRGAWWEVRCDCGNTCIKRIDNCVSGQTSSCGCLLEDVYKYQNKAVAEQCKALDASQLEAIRLELEDGATQAAIAKKYGVSPTTLIAYLKGRKTVRARQEKE